MLTALVKLPHSEIVTYDGVCVKLGMQLYFRVAPGAMPSVYEVVAASAVMCGGKPQIVVLGPNLYVIGMDPLDFVAKEAEWAKFADNRNPASMTRDNRRRFE